MRHVTSDRRDSTSPSSLLHLLFLLFSVLFFLLLFSPYPFVLLPVFLSSLSLVLFILHPFILSARHSLKKKTSCTDGLFFICISSLHLSVLCGSASLNPPVSPTHTPILIHTINAVSFCPVLFCFYTSLHPFSSVLLSHWLPSYFPTLPLFLPLHLLTPLVLSQLGCGLDRSGPPLPSPRLQQQHQPQIQVIQQL